MNPERWQRIKEILDVSLRLEPHERPAYLTRACEGDTEMREEVESLLEAHAATGELLETPPMQEPADPVLGARLGRIRSRGTHRQRRHGFRLSRRPRG